MTQVRRRIYVLDGSVAVTGAFVSAREMARALRHDADVVLVLPDTAQIAATDLTDFSAVHRLPIRPLRRTLRDAAIYLPCLLHAALRLRWLMVRDGADTLFVNDFYLMQGPFLRLLGYRGRLVTWVRIDPAIFGQVGRLWLWLASRASDRIISVSRHIQRLLPGAMPSVLLHNPVSAEFLPRPPPRETGRFEFVFVGNYIEGKGQDVALTALAEVLKTVPEARLRFHGGDMGLAKNSAYRCSLEMQAERLGVAEAVSFNDFAPSPRAALEGAFASLNLSKSESFSRTVLEASASGLPVIATRCGGPEEIIEDGLTGIMIPVGDSSACAEAMRMLCYNRDLAARMGDAGRQRVMQVFAPDTFTERLRALIEEAAMPEQKD
ncbi:glycosyltransferase family 4 protein [Cereibacter sphaeroides]|uniref:glycosyltransferase family 4 protein n=1 Tax=Cereibacter sphaeroides TaxID=1063 RepID=UPI001F2D618B|nr:glycosyltransferase family 4 protein [Cereibacter sphaeroides]MCE6967482.1 glycosyltransferase family 4 protein [Cereibacter sphaeroides]